MTTPPRILALAATALATSLVAFSPAPADADTAPFGAHWSLDDPAPAPPTAVDDSGNGNNGTNQNVVGTGTAYIYDGTARTTVPDSPSLSPNDADFSYGVTVITGVPLAGTDYDLLRKGFAKTSGGEFKVEILNGSGKARPFCLVKDSLKHTVSVRSPYPKLGVADGSSHAISCTKTATSVTITVDGHSTVKHTATGVTLGTVANTGALTLGAKDGYAIGDVNGDWSHVTLLDAWVR